MSSVMRRLTAPGEVGKFRDMLVRGHVKWFDTTKGYGFVVSSDGEGDILLHGNVLRVFGFTSVAEVKPNMRSTLPCSRMSPSLSALTTKP